MPTFLTDTPPQAPEQSSPPQLWKIISGWIFLTLSFALWGTIAATPFLGYTAVEVAGAIGVMIVVSEVLFWLGVLLLGKAYWHKVQPYLNPLTFFSSRKPVSDRPESPET